MTGIADGAAMRSAPLAAAAAHAPAAADTARVRRVAEDFEAMFLAEMLKPMFAELTAEEPFGGGSGEDIWRTFEVEEFGKALARAGGIGLADDVARQMLALQEKANG
jgi:Rod binding domain-containing protein